MNQTGHLVKRKDMELQKNEIPIEKGEPLKLELISFLESVFQAQEPKVGASLGKSALEVAITITEQICNKAEH